MFWIMNFIKLDGTRVQAIGIINRTRTWAELKLITLLFLFFRSLQKKHVKLWNCNGWGQSPYAIITKDRVLYVCLKSLLWIFPNYPLEVYVIESICAFSFEWKANKKNRMHLLQSQFPRRLELNLRATQYFLFFLFFILEVDVLRIKDIFNTLSWILYWL